MIIVSDANVIVYFWRTELLDILLLNVQVKIPEKIYDEITKGRILTDYPDLSALITQHRYNLSLNPVIEITTVCYNSERVLQMHHDIEINSGLDDGEIEGIVLSVLENISFVTNDDKAILYFNSALEHGSGGKAESFDDFILKLHSEKIIDQTQYKKLQQIKLSRD